MGIKKTKKIKVWCDFFGKINLFYLYNYDGPQYFRCPKCNRRLEIIIRGCGCCSPEILIFSVPRHKYWIKEKKNGKT
jgi:hypothetical protein